MPDIDRFFDEIDDNRSRRARELSEIKFRFSTFYDAVGSKAVVVLTYAHWEGFYNDCVRSYVEFLKANGGRMRDADWMMLAGAFVGNFQSLLDRRHSHQARREFIEQMQTQIDCGYDAFSEEVVLARSNLDFNKLRDNYQILNFDISEIEGYRLRLNLELVLWRHQVAHGDQPDLSRLDIANHVDLTSTLLLIVADHFQRAMLDRLAP